MHRLGTACLLALASCSNPDQPSASAGKLGESAAEASTLIFEPERITFSDIETNDLFGVGCGFAAGTGMSVVLMTMPEHAYMKLDGRIEQFAADRGSAKLPFGTWGAYRNDAYSVKLSQPTDQGKPAGYEVTSWRGSMRVLDQDGRIVYDETGTLQCGS
ncbi:hypothetical protein RM533_10515 [Croceicoccus sp. F390]|uniref:Lipoprotein n=1 Tax=Croceicoccus esteveae TaxID=3075597 RepID=A0ABU2ZJ25_9SPHN|nr:hypothetical protein [Croceicoccus sp. F390]MDT0576613.1 hypothetical protein [Croceicoccus sp. F390]